MREHKYRIEQDIPWLNIITDTYVIQILAGVDDLNPDDDFVDVHVEFTNGDHYFASFRTIQNILNTMTYWETLGDCQGQYLSADLIIVRKLTPQIIYESVECMIREDELATAFSRAGDPLDES